MADGPFGNQIYASFSSSSTALNLNTLLKQLEPLYKGSQGPTARGMFGQGHQQGQHSRLNAGAARGQPGMPLLYNFQQQQQQQQQAQQQVQQQQMQQQQQQQAGHHVHHHPAHAPHHQAMDHGVPGGGNSFQSSFPSGLLPSGSPFSAGPMQNGQVHPPGHPAGHGVTHPAITTRGGQARPITEHWSDQLKLHQEAKTAHEVMTVQHQPHYYARTKATENRGIGGSTSASGSGAAAQDTEEKEEDRRRPWSIDKSNKRQDWHNLDMSGQGIRTLSAPLFTAYTFLKELYIASNRLTYIPAEVGRLRHLQHLEASNNMICELPPEIGMCTSLKSLLLFDNQIRELPYELGSLFQLEMLGIVGNPLNATLRDEVMERGTKSLVHMLLEQSPVPIPPAPRQTVVVQEDVPANQERVKVLSWNILLPKFATQQQYGYTPTEALSWDYRKEGILQEIRERKPDILCLQEVSTDVFREFFSPELAVDDYKGVHWPRPKAQTMQEKEANAVDGCAVFYKASKWILLDKQLLNYVNISINRPDMKAQHDIFNRVMPKDNIALICLFESRPTGARMIVANTHLAWEPTLADVKLVQTAIMMENVTKLAEKYARLPPLKDKKMKQLAGDERPESLVQPAPSQEYRSNTEIPLLVCGDYNSLPDSGVYEFLSKGRVAPDHPDFQGFQYGSLTRDGAEHPFSLRSAYAHLSGTSDELPFTNYVPSFEGVIDYIWYSTNTLDLVELLGPPDREHLKRVPGFPNYHFPADHIQIMADFVFKTRKDKKVVQEPDFGPSSSDRKG